MTVLMIHGVGQEDLAPEALLEIWKSALLRVDPTLLTHVPVKLAYYGTTLARWTNGQGNVAVGMGAEAMVIPVGDMGELNFLSSVFEEAVDKFDIDEEAILAASEASGAAVPMNNFIARQLVGLVRVIEKISPAKGGILLRVVKQGYTYLNSPAAAHEVDSIVKPLLEAGPQVLITHSLGTVIAFKLLRQMSAEGSQVKIPLLITMGSPLALDAFKARLGGPFLRPDSVEQWENFYDPSDFVPLNKALNAEFFAKGIGNDGAVDNFTSNAHGVIGYLPHKGVVDLLTSVLKPKT